MSNATHAEKIKKVWQICYLLGFVTLFEIAAALIHWKYIPDSPRWWLNALFIILSAAKAYYIMSEFMHLKYELKSMAVSILAPFLFLVWGIIAFLWEGGYWLSLKESWNILK